MQNNNSTQEKQNEKQLRMKFIDGKIIQRFK